MFVGAPRSDFGELTDQPYAGMRAHRSATATEYQVGVSIKMGINFYFVSCGSVLDFFATQDPSSENQCWVDFGELGFEFDSLRELIAAR